jgi:hypothetical protein
MLTMSKKFYGKNEKSCYAFENNHMDSPFTQWGLDVIGPINPKSSKGHSYILTTTDYFKSGLKQ